MPRIRSKPTPRKLCTVCRKDKPLNNFYVTNSQLYSLDRRMPICKDCLMDGCVNKVTGMIQEDKLKNTLRLVDKPYYKDILQASIEDFKRLHPNIREEDVMSNGREIIAIYIKHTNNIKDISIKTYADSEAENFIHNPSVFGYAAEVKGLERDPRMMKKIVIDNDDFEVTDEMIRLFGEGYSTPEYRKMFNKYEKLKSSYSLQTNLHQEALATYVRFKVKEEDATARGDVDEASRWYNAAQNAAASGKLTPKQLSESDLHGGINSFSEIFKAVEQAVDIIPILPQFKYAPNDAPDFIIWCYINYARELEGLPQCEYKDVYEFYDKKKQEYIDQYGDPYKIFTDEPDESIRESVKKFITLPNNYEELGGDE